MKIIAVVAAALVLGSCSGGESEEERFSENTPMYEIQQEGVLRVAVPGVRPFGSAEEEGFATQFGRYIADDLGVDVEFVAMDSSQMGGRIAGGTADVAFPLAPVSYQALRIESVEEGYAYASPYLVAHQRLLVPEGSDVERLSDLDGGRVCSYGNEQTLTDLSRLVEVEIVRAPDPFRCVGLLGNGRVDAATATDAHLATMEIALEERTDAGFTIVGDQLNTEGYAAMALPGAMATYVIGELNDIEEESLWLDYYNRWLEPHMGPVDGPPDLTLQDAASLYPPLPSPSPSD